MAKKFTVDEMNSIREAHHKALEALECGYLGYLGGMPHTPEEKDKAKEIYLLAVIALIREHYPRLPYELSHALTTDMGVLSGMLLMQQRESPFSPAMVKIFAGSIALSLARVVALTALHAVP